MTPAWILDAFAALMLAVAAVSAGRLVAARPWQPGSVVIDTDVAHLLMAIAMAGMLAPGLPTMPSAAWEVIFGLLTAWFACRVMRADPANGLRALADGHCAPHLVHSAAMLYMFLAVAAPMAGNPGMGGSAMRTLHYPTLAFVFALILAGYSIWDLDQLSGRRYGITPARVPLTGVTAATFSAAPVIGNSATTGAMSGSAAVSTEVSGSGGDPAARGLLLAPATTVGCRVVMGISMVLMLLVMI